MPAPAAKPGKKVKRAEARPSLVWLGDEGLQELADRINAEFGAGTVAIVQAGLLVEPDKLVEVGRFLRDQNPIRYDYLASLQSVHYEDCIEVNYQLDSTTSPGNADRAAGPDRRGRGRGRGPLAHQRLARGRFPGARSLRHDGRPLRRPPRAEAHPDVGRLRLLSRSARTSSSPITRARPRSSTAGSTRASASTSAPRRSTPTAPT